MDALLRRVGLIAALILLCVPSLAGAVITFDAASTGTSGSSPVTYSHTVGAGSDRLLVVYAADLATSDVCTATYNGVPMTRAGSRIWSYGGADSQVHLFYLVAPDLGANNVVVTCASGIFMNTGAMSFHGVHQTTPIGTVASADGTSPPATINVSSASGDVVVDGAYIKQTGDTPAAGSGQTGRFVISDQANPHWGVGSTEAGASTVTMSYSWTGLDETWAIIAMPLKPSAASGDTTPPTDPAGLTATTVSTSQINLAWTGSTDAGGVASYLIERCQGAACVNFAQIDSVAHPTVTYSNTGLSASTLYRYRVRAQDTSGNLSGYTAIAQDTTLAGTTRTLTWTAQPPLTQDGFNIYRCVTSSGTCTPSVLLDTVGPAVSMYSDSYAGTPISCYTVQATSAAAGNSPHSNIACGQTVSTFNLTITVAGSGSGTTSPSGTTTHTSGTVVPLTATAGVTSDFIAWSGDADCTDGSVTMTANRACTATFNLQTGPPEFSYRGNRGQNATKTSSNTISVQPSSVISATNMLIVRATTDNQSATSGQTNEHLRVTDTLGNQYIKIREHTMAGGAANSGVTVSLWGSRPFSSITTANTVTLTTATARVANAISLEEYRLSSGSNFTVATATGVNGTSTLPSAVISGLSSAFRLFLGLVGIEGPNGDAYTQAVNYASATATNGTTGGVAQTNVADRFGSRRFTSTGDAFSPTLGVSRDWALVYAALATNTSVNSSSVTLTNSGTGGGTLSLMGVNTTSGRFYNGTVVRIEAAPNASSSFAGWTTTFGDNCTNATNTVVLFTLTQATECNAVFTLGTTPIVNYTLTINTSGSGTGTTGGAGVYASGTTVNMTATPNAGSTFSGWSGTTADCNDGTITMSADATCTATFTLLPFATMTTLNAGNGAGVTSGAGTYVEGSNAVLTATPAQGSIFTGWTGSTGCNNVTQNPLTVPMDASKTCTATYTLVTSGAPTGFITPSVYKRCTAAFQVATTSTVSIANVVWTVNGRSTRSQTPPNASLALTTAPWTFTRSLVNDGSSISAVLTDVAGQSSTLNPFILQCP